MSIRRFVGRVRSPSATMIDDGANWKVQCSNRALALEKVLTCEEYGRSLDFHSILSNGGRVGSVTRLIGS